MNRAKWLMMALIGIISAAAASPARTDTAPDKPPQKYYLVGTIGDNLKIQMQLEIQAGQVSGTYYYEKYGLPITLAGQADSQLAIKMNESVDEKVVGHFAGKLDVPGRSFEGQWSNVDSTKKLPFRLTTVAEFRPYSAPKFSGLYAFFYLRSEAFTGLNKKIENEIQRTAAKVDEGCENETVYGIAYYSDNLLSLTIDDSSYCEGAAHGMYGTSTENYVLRDAQFMQFQIRNILAPGPNSMKVLAGLVQADLIRQGASAVSDENPLNPVHLQVFSFNTRALTFYFSPYEVGSYAEGAYEVRIDYKKIMKILAPAGPLKPLLASQ